MKKFLITLFLGLFFCSFANANITFKDCRLEPNYGADAIFTINLNQRLIKVNDTYDLQERHGSLILKNIMEILLLHPI